MVRKILQYPDKKLYVRSKEVKEFDNNLHTLLDDMYETMIDSDGIGLAAIQIGEPLRALIISLPDDEGVHEKSNLLEIINPVFEIKTGETTYQEGCLSVPGYYEEVKRAEFVKVRYNDRYGNEKVIETDGLLAIALQHENDHLDGHLFIERIGYTKRKKFDKEYQKNTKNSSKLSKSNKTKTQSYK